MAEDNEHIDKLTDEEEEETQAKPAAGKPVTEEPETGKPQTKAEREAARKAAAKKAQAERLAAGLQMRARITSMTPASPVKINWRHGGEGLGGSVIWGSLGKEVAVGQWTDMTPFVEITRRPPRQLFLTVTAAPSQSGVAPTNVEFEFEFSRHGKVLKAVKAQGPNGATVSLHIPGSLISDGEADSDPETLDKLGSLLDYVTRRAERLEALPWAAGPVPKRLYSGGVERAHRRRAAGLHPPAQECVIPAPAIICWRVVEVVCGQPLQRFIEDCVLAPLGLENTTFEPLQKYSLDRIAPTEIDVTTGKPLHGVVHDRAARRWRAVTGGACGNAGLFSTAADLARFGQMWIEGGAPLLHEDDVSRAFDDTVPEKDSQRGWCWRMDAHDFMSDQCPPATAGHTGFTGPSLLLNRRTRHLAVILNNRVHPTRDGPDRLTYHRRLAAWLFEKTS